MRAVRRKVGKPRARAGAHRGAAQPLDRLVANQGGGVLVVPRVVFAGLLALLLAAAGALVVLPPAAVAHPRALKPAVESLVRVKVRLAEHAHLIARVAAEVDAKGLVGVEGAVDVRGRRGQDLGRRHRHVALDVVKVPPAHRLGARRRADWRVNRPAGEHGALGLDERLRLPHGRRPPAQRDVLVVG